MDQKWLTLSLPNSACIPILMAAGANAYYLWTEHWEHWSHMPPLEERVQYPYQNIRYDFDYIYSMLKNIHMRSERRRKRTEQLTSVGDGVAPRTSNGAMVTR